MSAFNAWLIAFGEQYLITTYYVNVWFIPRQREKRFEVCYITVSRRAGEMGTDEKKPV